MVSSSIPEDRQILPSKLVGCLESSTALEKFVKKFQDGKVIGICGMGGLGKTTAAKALFNHLHIHFEFTLFAENVKFVMGRCNGNRDKFERKIFAKFHHQGKKLLESESRSLLSYVTGKKILVVLDDVEQKQDDIKHIETQLSIITKLRDFCDSDKSRFLVTSRDKHVFREMDHQLIDFEFLDERNSNCLLAVHAIKDDEPEKDLEWKKNSVGKISEHCGCLPLSLEVLGKYLRGKPVDVWKETIKALREKDDKRPGVENVRKVLRISYDGLKPEEKEMFMDASTLFQNKWLRWIFRDPNDILKSQPTLRDAKAVWAVKYKNQSEQYWQTLVDKALVYHVPEDSPIQLHEHLKDLGESLLKQEGELVEVLYHEDEMDILLDAQGLRTPEMWQKIRFVCIRPGPTRSFWHSTLVSKGSKITMPRRPHELWHTPGHKRWHTPLVPEGEMLRLRNLEYLLLKDCGVYGKRVVLPPTLLGLCVYGGSAHNLCMAKCKGLVFLTLKIEEVERLPFSFKPFANLVKLSLSSTTIRFLPEDGMAKMPALQELRIECPRLEKLPESFGSLRQLHIFFLYNCYELKTLPESFGSLARLHDLALSGCYKLGALPESFGNLSLLRSLTIKVAGIETLPGSFGSLKGLESLTIENCPRLVTLPDSIGSLTALQRIRMSLSSVRRLPETFGDLQSLRYLSVEDCDSLETLPDTFGGLGQLMILSLTGLKSFQTLPATFGNLRSLQTLRISWCPNLKVLPDSFGSLEQLRTLKLWECDGFEAIPDTLGRLPCLERLEIWRCDMLETLPDSLGSLRALEKLSIDFCRRLRALPDTIGHLSRLKELYILGCDRLQTLPPSLVNLRHVRMKVNECWGCEEVVRKYGIQE